MSDLGLTSLAIRPAMGRVHAWKTPSLQVHEPHANSTRADLTVDMTGNITGCSAAAALLLDSPSQTLKGCAVKAVILHLPLSPTTPGYNLAYAVFHGTSGLWQRRTALASDGRKIFIEVAFSNVTIEGERFITLALRTPLTAVRRFGQLQPQ
jgi:hypothetical protein